jgi:hypothetical protein
MLDRLPLRRIRILLLFFMGAVALSGLTAFPLDIETRWLDEIVSSRISPIPGHWPALAGWVRFVHAGLHETYAKYPYMGYGTDWLAFAHLMIAVAFWGPVKDPLRNAWVVDWGMIACVAVIPLALICGHVRGIPIFWSLVDISFGVFGLVPLVLVRRDIWRLERSLHKMAY